MDGSTQESPSQLEGETNCPPDNPTTPRPQPVIFVLIRIIGFILCEMAFDVFEYACKILNSFATRRRWKATASYQNVYKCELENVSVNVNCDFDFYYYYIYVVNYVVQQHHIQHLFLG